MEYQPIALFEHEFTVHPDEVDVQGHVNNVVYVKWMQDLAILHSDANGGSKATSEAGAAWVVRSHKIEYFKSAYAGDRIRARTWIEDFRRVRSLRRYEFLRFSDEVLLARGETDWIFVNAADGRPRSIPLPVQNAFPSLEKDPS